MYRGPEFCPDQLNINGIMLISFKNCSREYDGELDNGSVYRSHEDKKEEKTVPKIYYLKKFSQTIDGDTVSVPAYETSY